LSRLLRREPRVPGRPAASLRAIATKAAQAGFVDFKAEPERIFQRDKNVEFSIFLTHHAVDCWDITAAAEKLGELLSAVDGVIEQLGLDGSELRERAEELKQEFIRTPSMLEPAKTLIGRVTRGSSWRNPWF